MKFSELGLSESLLRSTQKLGYDTATPIQAKAIPVVLTGADLIGCAQTGTGKTAAFTLPMLDRLMLAAPPRPARADNQSRGRSTRNIRALILAPTRELASQIGESLNKYGQFTPLRQTVVFGGVSQYHQVKALQRGVDLLVATPGRLLDLMNQGHIDLSHVEFLVLDEADQMLDMGFLPALKRIVAAVPKKRQTLMFSATMPDAIRSLAQQWLHSPQSVEAARVATPAERIDQSVHFVDKKRKSDLLVHLLRGTPRSRTLVFSRTKHGADKIAKQLGRQGVRAEAIHGNKSQNARGRALAQFKGNNPPVLVATDIAARGLDITGVTHVINFDLPEVPETYVHRIGRTARAGAEGIAISFCSVDERSLLKEVERLTKSAIAVEPMVEGFAVTETAPTPQKPRKKSFTGNHAAGAKRRERPAAGARNGAPAQGASKRRRRPKRTTARG